MHETAELKSTWHLEESERFTWSKSGAHDGHEFTVESVSLELFHGVADRGPCVSLRGPWLHGYTPDRGSTDGLGWQFLYAEHAPDADRIRELPLEVRGALASRGLRIPLTAAELELEPQIPVYEEVRNEAGVLISRRLVNPI
jgi:hypothetical protein